MIVSTVSGVRIDLQKPEFGAVRLTDVAEQLAKVCAHPAASGFYSVAQRGCMLANAALVEGLAPEVALHALLWYAPMAFVPPFGPYPLETIQCAIFVAFGLDYPSPWKQQLVWLEARCMLSELLQLHRGVENEIAMLEQRGVKPLRHAIKPLAWDRAAQKFIETWRIAAAGAGHARGRLN